MKRNISSSEKVAEPLDSTEQQKIIDDMRAAAEKQANDSRLVCFVVFLGIALIFAICFVYSFLIPFSFNHQMAFQELIPIEAFSLYYFSSCCTYLALAVMVRVRFVSLQSNQNLQSFSVRKRWTRCQRLCSQ